MERLAGDCDLFLELDFFQGGDIFVLAYSKIACSPVRQGSNRPLACSSRLSALIQYQKLRNSQIGTGDARRISLSEPRRAVLRSPAASQTYSASPISVKAAQLIGSGYSSIVVSIAVRSAAALSLPSSHSS